MIEAEAAQLRFDIGVALRGHSFEDDIEIVGRTRGRKRGIIQQQVHDRPADEGVVQTETVEAVGDRAQGAEVRLRHGRSVAV